MSVIHVCSCCSAGPLLSCWRSMRQCPSWCAYSCTNIAVLAIAWWRLCHKTMLTGLSPLQLLCTMPTGRPSLQLLCTCLKRVQEMKWNDKTSWWQSLKYCDTCLHLLLTFEDTVSALVRKIKYPGTKPCEESIQIQSSVTHIDWFPYHWGLPFVMCDLWQVEYVKLSLLTDGKPVSNKDLILTSSPFATCKQAWRSGALRHASSKGYHQHDFVCLFWGFWRCLLQVSNTNWVCAAQELVAHILMHLWWLFALLSKASLACKWTTKTPGMTTIDTTWFCMHAMSDNAYQIQLVKIWHWHVAQILQRYELLLVFAHSNLQYWNVALGNVSKGSTQPVDGW